MKRTLKKLLLLTIVVATAIICLAFSASALEAEGQCGENVNWQYNAETGELVISGEGAMKDYSPSSSPFYDNDDIKAVVIEDGITTVGGTLFRTCRSISSVTLPDSVTSINEYAFAYCTSLKSIVLPKGLIEIKSNAFYYSGLTSIELPETLKTIGEGALYNYTIKKVHIPASVTSIGEDAFPSLWFKEITVDENNKNYMSENGVLYNKEKTVLLCYPSGKEQADYVLPATVVSFDIDVFDWCSNLENIFVEEGNENYSSEEGVLFNKDKTMLVKYPNGKKDKIYTIPASVTDMGNRAFFSCDYLSEAIIPNSITCISNHAFYGADITKITIPDSVTYIDEHAFNSCIYLTKVVIPNSVASIGDSAFENCDSLTEVVISDNVKSISNFAFSFCNKLKDVTIGKGVTSIDSYAFNNSPVETVHYAGTQDEWNAIKGKDYLSSASLHFIAEKKGTAPSCTEKGYTSGVYCAICDKWFTGHSEIAETGHLDTKTYPEQKPTCTENGVTAGTYCSTCETWTEGHEVIPKINHKNEYIVDETKETCTTAGYTIGTYCPDCEKWTMGHEEIPAINHKNKSLVPQSDPTCNSIGYTSGMYCPDCETWLMGHEEIAALEHSLEDVYNKATLNQEGSVVATCTLCGYEANSSVIYCPKTIKLSSSKVTYNGKTRTPSVTVKDSNGNTLIKDTDYTVSYPTGRKLPGQYTITVKFKGNYEGEKELVFIILPKAPTTISAAQTTKVINLSWSESVGATGYRVYQYSPSKGKYVQIASIKGTTTYRKSTNLKAGTEYKFKIKPYTKLSDGTVLWGTASEAFATATECKAPKITSVTSPSKSKATVKWSNVNGETGYQLYYSTSKTSGYKKVSSFSADTLIGSKTFSSSASGKTIYFKVRAYKKVGGQTIYSEWSAIKSVKLK